MRPLISKWLLTSRLTCPFFCISRVIAEGPWCVMRTHLAAGSSLVWLVTDPSAVKSVFTQKSTLCLPSLIKFYQEVLRTVRTDMLFCSISLRQTGTYAVESACVCAYPLLMQPDWGLEHSRNFHAPDAKWKGSVSPQKNLLLLRGYVKVMGTWI